MSQAIFLAEIEVYDPDLPGTTTLRYGTVGWSTAPGDTPASTHFDERLVQPASIVRRAFSGRVVGGRAQPAYGDLVLANDDGELDGFIDYGIDGRSRRPLTSGGNRKTGVGHVLATGERRTSEVRTGDGRAPRRTGRDPEPHGQAAGGGTPGS